MKSVISIIVAVLLLSGRKREALQLIDHLAVSGVFILGADVLALTSDGYRHNYDSWLFELDSGSALESIEHARTYIKNYPEGCVT